MTGLAWDPSGSGRLGVATMSALRTIHAVTFSPDTGFTNPQYTYWDRTYDVTKPDFSQSALSVAATTRPDGSTVFAYGMADGSVKLFDPKVSTVNLLATSAISPNPVNAISFAPRIDGSTGMNDIVAVSSTTNAAQVLRYTGASTLVAQPLAPGGGTRTDVGSIQSWFPGYKSGSLSIAVSGDPHRRRAGHRIIHLATQPGATGAGSAPLLPGRSAFPSGDIVIDPAVDRTSPTYSIGGYTTGSNGDCPLDWDHRAVGGVSGGGAGAAAGGPDGGEDRGPPYRATEGDHRRGIPDCHPVEVPRWPIARTPWAAGHSLVSPQPHPQPPAVIGLTVKRLAPSRNGVAGVSSSTCRLPRSRCRSAIRPGFPRSSPPTRSGDHRTRRVVTSSNSARCCRRGSPPARPAGRSPWRR